MASRSEPRGDDGYTLVEVLVVILIVGILASTALPAFLRQERKGQDPAAKSDARNAVTQVEACYADSQDYARCTTASDLGDTGLDVGGTVRITAADARSLKIDADSRSGNTFTIERVDGGALVHSCTTRGVAGCKADGSW